MLAISRPRRALAHDRLYVHPFRRTFEDIDLLGPLLADRGYDVHYHDAGIERFDVESLLAPDLVIVLGGPIGVYESETYPFIAGEVAAIGRRLDADKPMLGICLGAQMMAAALGARVAPGPIKEIGWAPLTLTDAGQSLAELTWFRVGGPAQALFMPEDEDDLGYFLANLPGEIAVTVIGLGSNLIVRDGGVPGVVVRLGRGFGEVAVEDLDVRAGAAVPDVKVARAATRCNSRQEGGRSTTSPAPVSTKAMRSMRSASFPKATTPGP